jgi:hypothetical protein
MIRTLLFLVLCSAACAAQNFQRTIPSLKLQDGRVLREVSIVSFASTVVMAKWADGQGTIPYQLFPAEWREALEPMRPRPSAAKPRGESAVAAVAERKAEVVVVAADIAAVESLVSQQAAEIAELKKRVETLEKRFRQY